jgi:hypothetical protein
LKLSLKQEEKMSETQPVETQDVKQSNTEANSEEKTAQIPYTRFKEIVDEKNSFKTKYEELQGSVKQEKEAIQLQELEKKGEYDKIMTDMTAKLTAAETKANAFDQYQATRRESLLSKIPEDDRVIYDGLSLDKLEAHVDKFNSKPNPMPVDNSKASTMGGYASYEEWAHKDPEGYEKATNPVKNGGITIAYE